MAFFFFFINFCEGMITKTMIFLLTHVQSLLTTNNINYFPLHIIIIFKIIVHFVMCIVLSTFEKLLAFSYCTDVLNP